MRPVSNSYFSSASTVALSLFLVLPHFAAATVTEDCAEVRLDQPGKSFYQIPVRDQKFGTCSVETTTQLMEAMARDQGYSAVTRFSSLELAIRVAESFGDFTPEDFVGYNTAEIIQKAFRLGLCTQSSVSKSLRTQSLDEIKIQNLYSVFMERVQEIEKTRLAAHFDLDKRSQLRQRLNPVDNVDMGMNRKYYQLHINGMNQQAAQDKLLVRDSVRSEAGIQVSAVLDSKYKSRSRILSGLDSLKELFPISCESNERVNLKNIYKVDTLTYVYGQGFVTYTAGSSSIVDRIESALHAKNALPIPIGYCAQPIIDGRGSDALPKDLRQNISQCGPHASLIIGQRKNPETKRCEYLVRNSWGKDPESKKISTGLTWEGEIYSKTVMGWGFRGPGSSYQVKAVKNLTGNIWIDREDFLNDMAFWIQIYTR